MFQKTSKKIDKLNRLKTLSQTDSKDLSAAPGENKFNFPTETPTKKVDFSDLSPLRNKSRYNRLNFESVLLELNVNLNLKDEADLIDPKALL